MTVTATETMITAGAASKKKIARPRRRLSPGRFLAWALLIAVLVLTLFPFYWMLRTSFSSDKALFTNPTSILPADFTIGPYLRVLGLATPAEAIAEGGSGANVNFLLYLRNSVIYATAVTLGQLLFCSFAAYAFARLRWPGRNAVFFVFLTALMIPGIFTILPNFLLIRDIGLLNTIIGMILPTLLMAPFSIFFLRQFFLGINKEIE